jgi:hypothetical protein
MTSIGFVGNRGALGGLGTALFSIPQIASGKPEHRHYFAPGRRPARTRAASAALGRLTGMAYDQDLADRIRRLIASAPVLTEMKIFGGLAFLTAGHMAIAAGSGGAVVRVDPQQSDALVATTTASLVQMRGRPMPGWLHVNSDDLLTGDQLTPWVERGSCGLLQG